MYPLAADFSHALELKPQGCLRALYGILLLCAVMGTSSKGKGTKVDCAELLQHVQPLLIKCYTPVNGPGHPMRGLVFALLRALAVGNGA